MENILNKYNPRLKQKYYEIYMKYVNTCISLEDLGLQYGVSKQRVSQIIRLSRLGKGDYYFGLVRYNSFRNTIKNENPNITVKELNQITREWLVENNIKVIKQSKL